MPVCELRVNPIVVGVVQRSFDMDMALRFGSVAIADRTIQPPQPLVRFTGSGDAVFVGVRLLQKQSPMYEGREQDIAVRANPLELIARRDALSALADGARAAREGVGLAKMPRISAAGTLVAAQAQVVEPSNETMHLNLAVAGVDIILETDAPIARLALSSLSTDVLDEPRNKRMALTGRVGGLCVRDLNPDTKHVMALEMDAHELVEFDVQQFEPGSNSDCATAVKLRSNCAPCCSRRLLKH